MNTVKFDSLPVGTVFQFDFDVDEFAKQFEFNRYAYRKIDYNSSIKEAVPLQIVSTPMQTTQSVCVVGRAWLAEQNLVVQS